MAAAFEIVAGQVEVIGGVISFNLGPGAALMHHPRVRITLIGAAERHRYLCHVPMMTCRTSL